MRTSRRLKNSSNERRGAVINVVIKAIITIIEKIRGDRAPKSYPIFSTINSIKPRAFMSAPSDNESYQFIPAHRAAKALPPNFPAIATAITPAHINQSDQVFSKPTCVRSPVKAKKSGSRKQEVKTSNRLVRNFRRSAFEG